MQEHKKPGPSQAAQQAPAGSSRPSAPKQAVELSRPAADVPVNEDDDANFEFRPAVKYAGIAVVLALLVGIEYATYRGGYARGYRDAAHSGEVEASVNAAAVDNLRHFMQAASADDATLLSTIANRGSALDWIREPSVRLEAEWLLAQSALDRGKGEDITDVLADLFRKAPATEVWSLRSLVAARSLAATAEAGPSIEAYRTAIARLAALGNNDTRLVAMNEMATLLATSPGEGNLAALNALQEEAASLGEGGRLLRADIFAYMGRMHRDRGDKAAATDCFEKALDGVDLNDAPLLADASVCYGLALLEQGNTERAEALLREGVSRLGNTPAEISYHVEALRALARLAEQRGELDAALAFLYRAEGVATNRLPGHDAFWGCLYDQRGWMNLLKEAYDAALTDFRRCIELPAAEELLLQACEGAGRCCIVKGEVDDAVAYLKRSAELRERLKAHDVSALGRVHQLLGRAYDMQGDSAAASIAYARCAEVLASATEKDDMELRLSALMGQAYAQGQLKNWADAIALWEEVLPLVAGDAPRETEVRHQLNLCRRHGDVTAEDADEEAEPAEAEKPRPRSRRRRGRR